MSNDLSKFLRLFCLLVFFACQDQVLDKRDIDHAEDLIGLEFSRRDRDTMFGYLQRNLSGYDSLRKYTLGPDDWPALLFDPRPDGWSAPTGPARWFRTVEPERDFPEAEADLAYASIADLGSWLRSGQITSEALTRLYLDRLIAWDSVLHCVVTLTEDLALIQARRADAELRAGQDRGPLHGIPYGVKDLLAVPGYKTTWGSRPFRDQILQQTATVVQRLEEAGAVLVAKLTTGALARGDVWFGGQTMSPWDTLMGASGSSAGSGSATAAGLVGFSIGTETMGSITSPSARNGVTGLRPTYGRVSRYGVMSLSWSLDKVGPICRTSEDCALVMQALVGADSLDRTTYDYPFYYDDTLSLDRLRIGYLRQAIEEDTTISAPAMQKAIEEIHTWGLELIPKELPKGFPFAAFDIILRAESGAFFDELIRNKAVDTMVQQSTRSRANSLRQSRFIPAVEYLQANRHRRQLIEAMDTFMQDIDVLISPNRAANQLLITNLTGYPALALPIGLDSLQHPAGMTLIGRLFEEDKILRFGHEWQQRTDFHKQRPTLTNRPAASQ